MMLVVSSTNRVISFPGIQMSALKKGDVAIFDSRILHAGGASVSDQRRVLFYFTASASPTWPLPNGLHGSNSARADDRWQWRLSDVVKGASKKPPNVA
jgi:hypothetical protein